MINSIIFLDIDGVLNTINYLKRQKLGAGKVTNKSWDPTACKHISMLCEHYNARIVITSSWRHEYTIEQLKDFFASNNIPDKFIKDVTNSYVPQQDENNYCRGHEVQHWLEENNKDKTPYVIIDDEATFLESQQDHLIRVDKHKGFSTKEAVTRASNILEKNDSIMNEQEIIKLAKEFLCNNIEIEIIPEESSDIAVYRTDPENEVLVRFSLFEESHVGQSNYLTVSKVDGTIKYIGKHGE